MLAWVQFMDLCEHFGRFLLVPVHRLDRCGRLKGTSVQEDLPDEGSLVGVGEFGQRPARGGEDEVCAFAGGDGAC